MFGAVTPEKHWLIFVLLCKKMQNGHIWPIILEHARPISTNYSALIETWVEIINLTFVLRSLKGRFYQNQLIWDTFANVEFDRLQFLRWRFKTECNSAISIRALTAAMMQLYRVKIW